MRDMVFLSCIIVFWFVMSIGVYLMQSDNYIDTTISGNQSSTINPTGQINITDSVDYSNPTPKTYVDMLGRMFTFRLSTIGYPSFISSIISFINWFLVMLLGILIYRLIRSGAG